MNKYKYEINELCTAGKKNVITERSAIECWVSEDITHEAGTNRILFSVKFKVLPSKNTIVASETICQFGALIEHIMKNDRIRVNGQINQS